jgi:hypothetical protein
MPVHEVSQELVSVVSVDFSAAMGNTARMGRFHSVAVALLVISMPVLGHAQSASPAPTENPADTETRAPRGATFEQLTPHDHYLAARDALDQSRCPDDTDCRNVDLALRHVRAVATATPANRAYLRTHRIEFAALMQQLQAAHHEAPPDPGPAPRPTEAGGNFREVRAFLATHLDNPRSYQPVHCDPPAAEEGVWRVTCSFRAANRVGATTLQVWTFQFQGGRVVDGVPIN